MIRKLNQGDNYLVMPYLMEEKSFNLFIIGDIENNGYDCEFQDIWADLDEDNNIRGILLRYYHSYVVYSKGEFDIQGFTDIINSDNELEIVSGKRDVLNKIEGKIKFSRKRETYFAEMLNSDLLDENVDLSDIKKATLEDIDALFALREMIEEFDTTPSSKESLRQTIESKSGRTYFMEKDGIVLSCASTTAENSASAMVVGVCTHPEFRRQGLASRCMIALCKDLLKEGKSLCLFYDNPEAGNIYKGLGFKDIGMWTMYHA